MCSYDLVMACTTFKGATYVCKLCPAHLQGVVRTQVHLTLLAMAPTHLHDRVYAEAPFSVSYKGMADTDGLAVTLPACLFPLPGHKFMEGSDYLCIPVMPGIMPFLHIRSFIEFNWRDEMYLLKTITSAHTHKHGNCCRKQNGLLSWCGPANLSDFKYIMALSPLSNFL